MTELVSETLERDTYHMVLQLTFHNMQYMTDLTSKETEMMEKNKSGSSFSNGEKAISCELPVRSEIFFELFPFHLAFDRCLGIISLGVGLQRAIRNCMGESIKDIFNINRPMITLTWENV